MILEILLIISVVFNVILAWYIVKLIRRLLMFQDILDDFVEKLKEYEKHVDIIYNLERFYGDITLENLLRHSKEVAKECKNFRAMYHGVEDEETDEEEYEEGDASGA